MTRRTALALASLILTLDLAAQINTKKFPKIPPGLAKPGSVVPIVSVTAEPYRTNDGKDYTIYKLAVTNIAAFADVLFVPTPGLPPNPCRSNEARLIWEVRPIEGRSLACGSMADRSRNVAQFRVRRGQDAPDVRLVLTDTKTGAQFTSEVIAASDYKPKIKINPLPEDATRAQVPSITLTGRELQAAKPNRPERTLYKVTITNAAAYPESWFTRTTALGPHPCGDARLIGRTTVTRNGQADEVVCEALDQPGDLVTMQFTEKTPLDDADTITVSIEDRLSGKTFTSSPYTVGWYGLTPLLATVGCKQFLGRAGSFLCTDSGGMSACEKLRSDGKPIACTRAGKAQS